MIYRMCHLLTKMLHIMHAHFNIVLLVSDIFMDLYFESFAVY
jgi:hypothetical protein